MAKAELKTLGQWYAVSRQAGDRVNPDRFQLLIRREDALGDSYWEEIDDVPQLRLNLAREIWEALEPA